MTFCLVWMWSTVTSTVWLMAVPLAKMSETKFLLCKIDVDFVKKPGSRPRARNSSFLQSPIQYCTMLLNALVFYHKSLKIEILDLIHYFQISKFELYKSKKLRFRKISCTLIFELLKALYLFHTTYRYDSLWYSF